MYFNKKLKLLMSIFNINSRRLSKAIHVDPSSISRWLNNKRIPSPNSVMVDKMIDFFLNIDAFEFQKEKMHTMILPPKQSFSKSTNQIANSFREWLFSPYDTMNKGLVSVEQKVEEVDESQIDELLSTITKPSTIDDIRIQDFSIPMGLRKEVEVFNGKEGIQQALLHLGLELLQQKNPGELIITSQDHYFWRDDQEFISLWMDLLKNLIQKGHRVKVLYNLNQGLPQVTQLIIGWIPLFATGRFEAYFYPKYVDNTISMTLAVVPGRSAVCSFVSKDESLFGSTFLYRDYSISEYFKSKLEKLIANAKPLIHVFSSENMISLHEEISMIEEGNGCRFICRNGLTSLTIPLPLFKRLLEKTNLSKSQKEKRYALQKLRLETLKNNINHSIYFDICFMEAIDAMLDPKGCEYYLVDIFSSGVVMGTPQDVLEHLENVVEMLNRLDNFEIALVNRHHDFGKNTMYWAVKENIATLISTWDAQGMPMCFLIKENTLVHEFEKYFVNRWDMIPTNNKDKKWVIEKLQSKIKILEKIIEDSQNA